MATPTHDLAELKRRMHGALVVLKQELAGLRTGRASPHLLDPVQVDAYGTHMPLNQVATISVPEPRLLTVQVWDKSLVHAVEKAIVKLAHKYAENARVAVRHVRRDGLDVLKKLEKDHKISEDDHKHEADRVQKATDEAISEVDQALAAKEKEIMTV